MKEIIENRHKYKKAKIRKDNSKIWKKKLI